MTDCTKCTNNMLPRTSTTCVECERQAAGFSKKAGDLREMLVEAQQETIYRQSLCLLRQQGEIDDLNEMVSALTSETKKYNELLMAVASRHSNETRHDTALRYIKSAEARACGVVQEEGDWS